MFDGLNIKSLLITKVIVHAREINVRLLADVPNRRRAVTGGSERLPSRL